MLRVVRLHHAFFPTPKGENKKRKEMKELSNTGISGKVQYAPPSDGSGGILTDYQQLPIKVFVSRLMVQPLIEKITSMVMHFHHKRLALVRL
ncbi:hypothetical protein [Niastella sp.]|uniref:hypothetical protein n=1 Tax=Niastella sp. TaxID=1869183 RepID=UPI00389A6B72